MYILHNVLTNIKIHMKINIANNQIYLTSIPLTQKKHKRNHDDNSLFIDSSDDEFG